MDRPIHLTTNNAALLSMEARLAMNDTEAFTTVLEASFASGRVIEVNAWVFVLGSWWWLSLGDSNPATRLLEWID